MKKINFNILKLGAHIILPMLFMFVFVPVSYAQTNFDLGTNLDPEDSVDLEPITFTFFEQNLIDPAQFSIFSWLATIGNIFTIGIILYWIGLLIQSGLVAFKSDGKDEGLADAYKKVQATFRGVLLSVIFPLILTILGIIFQVGPFWNWPKAFQNCASPDYDFYFQALISSSASGGSREFSVAQANAICGY